MPTAGCCCGTIAREPMATAVRPLLIEKSGRWYVAGVDVAAETGIAGGFAVVVDEPRKRL